VGGYQDSKNKAGQKPRDEHGEGPQSDARRGFAQIKGTSTASGKGFRRARQEAEIGGR
jgi:hypothetical protein